MPNYFNADCVAMPDRSNEFNLSQLMKDNGMKDLHEVAASLSMIIESYQNLPDHALDAPISHRDYLSLLTLLREAFKAS